MTYVHTPAQAFAPGEYLRDELEERGWTTTEFAELVGRSVREISGVIDSGEPITSGMALALSKALGTSQQLWLNLQTSYETSCTADERDGPSPTHQTSVLPDPSLPRKRRPS